jgi:hypothetical protein
MMEWWKEDTDLSSLGHMTKVWDPW